jgi:cytochrome b subunit of formate dehydrogenase/NAD-dependent dihydropyrimidine dehydrogenase PreA subunit
MMQLHGRDQAAEDVPARLEILDGILDRVHPPVARFRIISNGLARNHTLQVGDDISGTRACLSCGNCVDACPVVAGKPRGTMFVRTSMLLEHVVADECRRCYQCVAACPQVNRPVKDYVRAFRRVERATHWTLLVLYLALMGTGILINHWGEGLPADLRYLVGLTHRICAVGLLLTPMLLLLDRRHLAMAVRMAFTWSADDLVWLRNTWGWLWSGGKRGALKRGAYNPGQRLWYLYVPAALLVFAATGTIKWIGVDALGKSAVETATLIHVTVAVLTDVLLLLHVYLKLGWPILRDGVRNTRYYVELQQRRRTVVPLGAR